MLIAAHRPTRFSSMFAQCWCIGFLAATLSSNAAQADEQTSVFRAGAFAIDITPEHFPVSSAGSMSPRNATQAHDPLHARCIVLDDGETRLAFAICDSCMIPRDIFDTAKQTVSETVGIPTDHILMSATHTHTAVTATPVFQSDVDQEYCSFLSAQIAKGIVQATSQLEPARIGWAVGNNPRHVFNRRWYMRPDVKLANPFGGTDTVRMNPPRASSESLKPAGLTDPEVPVVSLQALDGRPIAVLANYSLHYVGGVPAETLSGDYFAEFANQLTVLMDAASADPPFVGVMSNGTSGDINNLNFFENTPSQEPFEQIRLVAADVAQSAHSAIQRIEYYNWVPLTMQETEVELGVRRPTANEVELANQLLRENGDGPLRGLPAIYANETIGLLQYPPTVTVKLQAIRIGGLGIVTTPCETFVETGLAIKHQSPFKPTFTIELANGYNGYLPTPEQHALGGYEAWRAKSSYLAVDSEPKIRGTLLELLNSLAPYSQAATDR
jgi:neutral ceramidase